MRIREREVFRHSEIVVMVERNLGFEAEHHHRALSGIPLTRHRIDHQAQRYGVLTTEEVCHLYGLLMPLICSFQHFLCIVLFFQSYLKPTYPFLLSPMGTSVFPHQVHLRMLYCVCSYLTHSD